MPVSTARHRGKRHKRLAPLPQGGGAFFLGHLACGRCAELFDIEVKVRSHRRWNGLCHCTKVRKDVPAQAQGWLLPGNHGRGPDVALECPAPPCAQPTHLDSLSFR